MKAFLFGMVWGGVCTFIMYLVLIAIIGVKYQPWWW